MRTDYNKGIVYPDEEEFWSPDIFENLDIDPDITLEILCSAAGMSKRDMEIVILFYRENITQDKIAEKYYLTQGNVSKIITKSLDKIKAYLTV